MQLQLEPGVVSFLQNDVNQTKDQLGFYVSDYVSASGYGQWGPLYFVHPDGSIDLTFWDQRFQLPGYRPMFTIPPGVERWATGLAPFSLPVRLFFYAGEGRLRMGMWEILRYDPGQIWGSAGMSAFFASQSLDHTSSFDTNAKFDVYTGSTLTGTYTLMDFYRGVPVAAAEQRLVSRPFSYRLGRPTPIEGTTQSTFNFDPRRSDPNSPIISHVRIEQSGVLTDTPTGPASIKMQVGDYGADYWNVGLVDASDVRLEWKRNGTTTWVPLAFTKNGREYSAEFAQPGRIDLRVTAQDASGNSVVEEWTPAFIMHAAGAPAFTDHPLTAGTTAVKGMHITELRQAIEALRTRHPALGTFVWTDATLVAGGTLAKAVHLTELRTALNDVYAAAVQPVPTYTHATITGGTTVITAVDIAELRAAILAIW